MKKLLTLFAVLAMFAFTGCEDNEADNINPDNNQTEQPEDGNEGGGENTEDSGTGSEDTEVPDDGNEEGTTPDDFQDRPKIEYTTTDDTVLVLREDCDFGDATVVSNTYSQGIGTIEFDKKVTTIGDYTFYNYPSLERVVLYDGITKIGESAFGDNKNLISVIIPNSVTSIGNSAFRYCESLENIIKIPEGIETIGDHAFYGCSNVIELYLPSTLKTLEYGAFAVGESLAFVHCKATTPPAAVLYYNGGEDVWVWYGFDTYTQQQLTIHVPEGSVGAYKAADGWKEYADSIFGCDFDFE